MTDNEQTTGVDTSNDVVDATNYKEIVDNIRKEYESKLADEKAGRLDDAKKYATAVLNGQVVDDEPQGPQLAPAKELREEYIKIGPHDITDVQKWTKLLNWRDSELAESNGENDIFCLTKPNEKPSEEARASAERTADVVKQCIEDSNYDDDMFKVLLDKRLSDPVSVLRKSHK